MRGGGLSWLASLSALRRFDNRDRSSPALFLNLKRQNRKIKLLFFRRWDVVFPIRVGDETSTHRANVFGIKGGRYAKPISLYLERKKKMMRNLILSTLSTLALLIYPLSLSAQNSFSLSLDVNGAAGDQAVTSLNVSADQVVAIQIFGKDIQNANGLAVRFEYDASQVVYEGFDVGDVLPNAQALPEQGTGYVEIGMASLGGQATANSGLAGTVRFRTTAAFSGTAIRLVRAELSQGGRFETIMPNIRIALQGTPPPANFSLSLDVDGSAGDQSVTSANVSTDEVVPIHIFGKDIQYANGVSIRFEYDASQVTYDGFDTGDVLPNAQALPSQGTNPTFVEIGIASFGGQATVNSGLIGTVRFRTTAGFSGTAIQLVRAELGRGGRFETITLNVRVALELQALTPDFNGDGMVNFADFLAFAGQFGARQGDGRYEAKYDLDSDGAIGFGDFLIFSSSFGKDVSTPGGNGSGGSTTNVDIPDANLRAVIEDSLGKATGTPITRAEMVGLTRLDAPNSNISDLTGLEFATGLTHLDLGPEGTVSNWGVSGYRVGFGSVSRRSNSNEIANLSPLSGMTRLEYLDLGSNLISDVSALSGLTSLTYLDLYDNFILDVSALSNLTNLTSLDLYNNLVSDISALSSLTRLEKLFLGQNTISDVSALANLTSLETLDLKENSIPDVSALLGLTRLADLNLDSNSISDISALANLSNLKWLALGKNLISDISALRSLTGLEKLFLGSNVISDFSSLSTLTNLTDLELTRNAISDVSALRSLTNLERLQLSVNAISDLTPLGNLNNLTGLYLNNNTISDLTPLSNLTNLERLGLNVNAISDLTPLSNLTNLTNLQVWSNNISDVSLSPLGSLTNLVTLYLHGNPVSDVSALSGLTNLTGIGLNRTAITDVSTLANLTNLTSVFTLRKQHLGHIITI